MTPEVEVEPPVMSTRVPDMNTIGEATDVPTRPPPLGVVGGSGGGVEMTPESTSGVDEGESGVVGVVVGTPESTSDVDVGPEAGTGVVPAVDVPVVPVTTPEEGLGDDGDVDGSASPDGDEDEDVSDAGGDVFEGEPSGSPVDDDGVCFDGLSVVDVENVGEVRMRDLKVGMKVWVGGNVGFSKVFMFSHKVEQGLFEFVKLGIKGESGVEKVLRLTSNHYLYVGGSLKAAGGVVVGDEVVLSSSNGESKGVVESVERVTSEGLYNPQTLQGDIVVNGIKASTYTKSVAPRVARALLAPFRIVYQTLGIDASAGLLEKGGGWFTGLLPKGPLVHDEL